MGARGAGMGRLCKVVWVWGGCPRGGGLSRRCTPQGGPEVPEWGPGDPRVPGSARSGGFPGAPEGSRPCPTREGSLEGPGSTGGSGTIPTASSGSGSGRVERPASADPAPRRPIGRVARRGPAPPRPATRTVTPSRFPAANGQRTGGAGASGRRALPLPPGPSRPSPSDFRSAALGGGCGAAAPLPRAPRPPPRRPAEPHSPSPPAPAAAAAPAVPCPALPCPAPHSAGGPVTPHPPATSPLPPRAGAAPGPPHHRPHPGASLPTAPFLLPALSCGVSP